MEIISSGPKLDRRRRAGGRQPAVLSMYDEFEDFQKMSLDQFAKIGWDRVRVLQKFDELSGQSEMPEVEKNAEISACVKKHMRARSTRAIKSAAFDTDQLLLTNKSKDALSHFVCRLAYCRTTELRGWFLNQEIALFKWRFQHTLRSDEQAQFVQNCSSLGDACQMVTAEEFRQHGENLQRASRVSSNDAAAPHYFYKIRFEHVTDLVRRRQALMVGGWAFVHRGQIVGMLAGMFRAKLNKALVLLARKWPSFARVEKDRLLPIVAQLTADRRQLANPVDDKAVLMTFTKFIQRMGHSEFKTKQLGRNTVSLGSWRRPNEVDKMCPFAKRVHKSNTVFYTIYLADKVMIQRCWDSDCRHGRRYFQIRGGKVVDLRFEPPNRQTMTEAEKKLLGPVKMEPAIKSENGNGGGAVKVTAMPAAAPTVKVEQ